VIVSASRGQYLKPGSKESGFFSLCIFALLGIFALVLFSHCIRNVNDMLHRAGCPLTGSTPPIIIRP
jgi:hypothetical protein